MRRAGAGPSLTALPNAPWRVEALDNADVTGLKLERACRRSFASPNPDYIELWKTVKADSAVEEVIRNFIRQPVLWME